MKVNQIIYNYKEFLEKHKLSVDEGSNNRWVYNHLLNFRATLLNRKKINAKLTGQSYQTISSFPLIEVQDIEFPCLDDNNCILLRTKFSIPDYLKLHSITSGLNSQYTTKFEEIDPSMIKYKQYSKYPSQSNYIYYYKQDTGEGLHIYFWSDDPKVVGLKTIAIKAIFYDPALVQSINDCGGEIDPCYNYLEANFNIDPELLTEIYNFALSTLLRTKNQTDILNDDSPITNIPVNK